MGPTPLLDFFKRGEVERDVRLQAAQGTLAPRAHEQLAILVLLLEDPDREIRETADETINKIPVEVLEKFLARSDVPVDLREFFGDRGIFPAEIPPIEVEFEDALIDLGEPEEEERISGTQELAAMNFPQRLKAAMKGSREQRAILIRDPQQADLRVRAEQPQGQRAGSRELRADAKRVGRRAADHRPQPRLAEELWGHSGADQEPEDAVADVDAADEPADR